MGLQRSNYYKQAIPVTTGFLVGIGFGIMLGWASNAFPLMLQKNDPIEITLNQSAMIAGFLMHGNIIGIVLEALYCFECITIILVGCSCQIIGWLLMHYAGSISELAFSRILVGFGYGFTFVQLREFVDKNCGVKIYRFYIKYAPLAVNIGIVISYVMSAFVSFREFSLGCTSVPIVALALASFVSKQDDKKSVQNDISTICNRQLPIVEESNVLLYKPSFINAVKDGQTRKMFVILCFLTFINHYTGNAANIVYSEIIYDSASNPLPRLCPVVYSLVYLLASIVVLKYNYKLPIKTVFSLSLILCAIPLCAMCFYFYFKHELLIISNLFVWLPLALLSIFNILHTLGISKITTLFISDIFPKSLQKVALKFSLVFLAIWAFTSTKIFQVIFTYFGMHMAFAFLATICVISAIITVAFIDTLPKPSQNSIVMAFRNKIELADETATNNSVVQRN